MLIKEKAFQDETFFFELINKFSQSESKRTKNVNNYCDPPHPKIYYTCYAFDEELDYNSKTKKDKIIKLHTQKVLVISSFYHFHMEFYEILKAIKKCIENNIIGFELEKVIHSLVFDIPSPCPGITKVAYDYSGLYKVEFELNPINKIPKSGADLKIIFNHLNPRTVFDILKYVILEIPVIVFCLDKNILSNVVKALEELLLPFTYPYPVIPILPKEYFKALEKLSCFIVGINQKYLEKDSDEFFEINNINLNDKDYVIVSFTEQEPYFTYKRKNLEKYEIVLKDFNKVMQKNKLTGNYLIKDVNFPKHYLTKLMKNLNQLFYGKNGSLKSINTVENDDIRYQFYYFFSSMLQHYKSFLITDSNKIIQSYSKVENDTIDLNDIFKFQEFLLKADDSIDFFNFFVHTRIWKTFLIKNIYPSTIDEKLEVLLLDENIRKKKNKNMIKQLFKENTPFLETNRFDIRNTELIKITYDADDEMHLSTIDNRKKTNFPLLDETKTKALYNQNFLFSNVKIKNLYEEFYTECQIVLKDKKFLEPYYSIGYKININEDLKINNENYILKLWFLLMCYNFRHLDKSEKWAMFNELIKEIQSMSSSYKISILDPFLSDLMFTTFIKYGDKIMCSLLYKELNEIPSVKEDYLIFTQLHKKFINKKEEFKFTLPKETILKEKNYNLFNLPKGNKNKIYIALVGECIPCSRIKIDLKPAILNFSSMTTDEILFKCHICKKYQNAIITIYFGKDINQQYYYQLYTPKYLFYFIKNLGDYNMEKFYEDHSEIFFNLITLFQLRGNNYDFLFPYKEKQLIINNKPYYGFNPNNLQIKKAGENKYIKKNANKNKINWYEDIVPPENQYKRKFSKIIPSRRGSVEIFKTFEPLSSASFFKKNISKKKEKKNFYTLKYSKTINEN